MVNANLGDRVKDPLTGFEGVVTARYDYLYGCVRINVERKSEKGIPEEVVFDELRLQLVTPFEHKRPDLAPVTGGPRDDPHARR